MTEKSKCTSIRTQDDLPSGDLAVQVTDLDDVPDGDTYSKVIMDEQVAAVTTAQTLTTNSFTLSTSSGNATIKSPLGTYVLDGTYTAD